LELDIKQIGETIKDIAIERIDQHLQYFCEYEKLSGEPEALKSVEYICDKLKQYGIEYQVDRFMAYLSNPIESTLTIGDTTYASRPRSFSALCREGIQAELVYDHNTKMEQMTELEKDIFYRTFKGKIVIGYGFDERYAKVIEQYGAAGWIQIWNTPEPQIHEDTVSPVWGTPDIHSRFMQMKIPVVAVTMGEGETIIALLQNGKRPVKVDITAIVETGVKEVVLPVAHIEGKTDDFVLVSGHYDTWYIGAFDNGTANAGMLEMARVFQTHRKELHRSIRIAWWPGHSNGRYTGSAWYCDHYWNDLYQHCIAHLNLDLLGAKETDQTLAVRTTGLEGKEFIQSLTALTDPRAEFIYGRISRGADQSFWGTNIPYHINLRYEVRPERRISSAPGPGRYWWHTEEDTYDKVDLSVLEKEIKIITSIVFALAEADRLPINLNEYFGRIEQELEWLSEKSDYRNEILAVKDLFFQVYQVWNHVVSSEDVSEERKNVILQRAGGVINRLMQSSGSPYEQDPAFAYGSLHLFGESSRLKKAESPTELYLFYDTSFCRQKNRIITELNELLEKLICVEEMG